MFSGIEAASVAWEPLGFEPLAFAEVDPFPSAVLKKRYPHVPNLGDITSVDWREYHGKADIVVGGSPCQSFSVAGLRKGLDDPRGSLMLHYLRACDRIKPEWIVWENVPGVLSADGGRAFGAFIGALEELGYHAAWRVLDAQFFGMAQRRRRVFVVANARDWRRAAAVLFERESLFGDFNSSREAREGLAAAAQGGAGAPGGAGRVREAIGFSYGNSADSRSMGEAEGVTPTIRSAGGGNSVPVICEPGSPELYSIVGNIIGRKPENGGNGNGFQDGSEPMYTLTAVDRHAVCTVESPCLNPWATQSDRVFPEDGVFPSLVGGGRGNRGYAGGCILEGKDSVRGFAQNTRNELRYESGDGSVSGALAAQLGMKQQTFLESPAGIRRLTPVECERLQGFPDGWTRIAWNGKPEEDCPNGRRYKAIGNSMAVPVMRWIGEGIVLVEGSSI